MRRNNISSATCEHSCNVPVSFLLPYNMVYNLSATLSLWRKVDFCICILYIDTKYTINDQGCDFVWIVPDFRIFTNRNVVILLILLKDLSKMRVQNLSQFGRREV